MGHAVLRRLALAGALAAGLAITAQASTLSYEFSGGLQGWTQIGTSTRAPWNSGGNSWGATQAGSVYGYDGDDGADNTYWLRSPEFRLDGSGPLTVRLWGGAASGAAPANEAAVPPIQSAGGGFKGVVLREAATGNFVKSLTLPANNGNADVSLSAADLAPYANNGKNYTLDYLDTEYGGWGWCGLDNVTIPGFPMEVLVAANAPSIRNGGTGEVTITIPTGFNATSAVTVYVTNSNPAILSVNGSAAAVVPVTFAAGANASQVITVAGTGLGYVQLTAGSAGLVSGSDGFPVLTRTGLIGRWLTGSEDLLDKSGYLPGAHDGTLIAGGAPATPYFSADVPPGAAPGSMSLDLASSGGAVIINNTITMDAAYRPTFDEGTSRQLSVVFWAKGLPATWNPLVSKFGEGSTGWQVRKRGDQPVATFTVRGTAGEDDPFNGSTLIDDGNWHHYAGTWDSVTGMRRLYIDGKLNGIVPHDGGKIGVANVNYLTLGGRSEANSSTPGANFTGQLFDVQIFGTALSGSAVQQLFAGTASAVTASADRTTVDLARSLQVDVAIPAGANASAPVTVSVVNSAPAVLGVAGAVGNTLTLTFPAGGASSQSFAVTGLAEGAASFNCTAPGLAAGSIALQVHGPKLIGHWLGGQESFANQSTFTPPGTHNATEVGTAGNITWSTDTPPSKSGRAAQFGGEAGLVINNTSLLDGPTYVPTFDDVIANQFSVAFWAKGIPGTWNGFVSKRGEEAIGWQVRRGGGITEAFTIRGTGSGNEDGVGSVAINDGKWHHYAAVWDGWSGTRKCYIDGVLDPSVNLASDFAPMTMAPNKHLILGARAPGQVSATPAIEGAYSGLLYDVRVYNYPLSLTEVSNLSFVAAINITPAMRSLQAPNTMTVDIILPAGATASQAVSVQVQNQTPAVASLVGASGNTLTLNFPVGGSLTQQVTVAGIADGKARLTATGGGFAAGAGTFNVWADPGRRLVGHWITGGTSLADGSGFRPAGTHDGYAVGANAGMLMFSYDVPPVAPAGAQSLDLSYGNVAVMITNSSSVELGYVETFDAQIASKFTIAFWAKGTPSSGDWNPWISKRGEDGQGYQVRRFGSDYPVRPTFTVRGTAGEDDPGINTTVDDGTWHHYAATYDSATGIRRLYLDGAPILGLSRDFGPMTPAMADHLVLGGRDYGAFGNFFPGWLYDVRVYSYALDATEIGVMVNPPSALTLALSYADITMGTTVPLVVTLPVSATASSPVTVYLTNNSPSVVTIVGSTGNVFPLVFPVGTFVQTVSLQAIGAGQVNITAGTASLGSATLTTINNVTEPNLIGHWLGGASNLADTSGFHPAGTHDGYAVGPNAPALAFSDDVPAGFPGKSLDLRAGNVGVLITNSANVDTAYQPTFDDAIAANFSVAFWAKGFPADWAGWVSKRGEGGIGWQVRRMGSDPIAGFTLRGVDNDDGWGSAINVNDNPPKWHHFAAVWDQAVGTRALYVDGVFSHYVFNNPAQSLSMAPDKHLALGARAGGGTDFEAYFSGLLYDVRVYDYPLSAPEITAMVTPPASPTLQVQAWTGSQVRISWPAAVTGYTLEASTSVAAGWGPAGLTVAVEGNENVAYATATGSARFFRLKK